MDEANVELMVGGFDVAIEGSDGIQNTHDRLEVRLHGL